LKHNNKLNFKFFQVALVAQKVSNAIISQGRLAFWQDCLDKPGAPHHPVALELHRARSRHKLSKAFLQRLVSSRRAQIDRPGHESLTDLEQYAEDTVSPLIYLALQSAGAQNIHVICEFILHLNFKIFLYPNFSEPSLRVTKLCVELPTFF
jgi:hypothetical protein